MVVLYDLSIYHQHIQINTRIYIILLFLFHGDKNTIIHVFPPLNIKIDETRDRFEKQLVIRPIGTQICYGATTRIDE